MTFASSTEPRSAGQERGFSLLEVLVAFAITALAMSLLLRGYGHGAKATALATRYSRALNIAESVLATTGLEQELDEGERSGESDDGYTWVERISVRPDDPDENTVEKPDLILWNVEVQAGWEQGTSYRSVTLMSLRVGPT